MANRVYPDKTPNGIAILHWDGSDLRVPRCDEDHHPQVDVLTSALPTGAATEPTLAEISERIGATTDPEEGSANAHLEQTVIRLGDITSPATGSVNEQLGNILTRLLSLADIIYQGDHHILKKGFKLTNTGVYGTCITATVPVGKVWYIYAFGSSADSNTERIDMDLLVGGIARLQTYYVLHSPTFQGVCFYKAIAEQAVAIRCKQNSGADMNIYGFYAGIEVDA